MTGVITDVKNDLCQRKAMGKCDCQEHQERNEMTVGIYAGSTPLLLGQWITHHS